MAIDALVSQGISSHGIDKVIVKYSRYNTKRIKKCFLTTAGTNLDMITEWKHLVFITELGVDEKTHDKVFWNSNITVSSHALQFCGDTILNLNL